MLRPLQICLDLLSQRPDIDAQVLHVRFACPDLAQNHFMGQHLARMSHQESQQIVFPRREFHLSAPDRHDPANQVYSQITATEYRVFTLLLQSVPLCSADASEQLTNAEWLG